MGPVRFGEPVTVRQPCHAEAAKASLTRFLHARRVEDSRGLHLETGKPLGSVRWQRSIRSRVGSMQYANYTLK
jgi:hypothetical protein